MEFFADMPDVSGSLFYITHIDNVPSIISNGILSHNSVEDAKLEHTPVYDHAIISNRKKMETGAGKSLWEYVNLYFQPRNPMLYQVLIKNSIDCIVMIAVKKSVIETLGVFICDGNAASVDTRFYSNNKFSVIEPEILKQIKIKYWKSHDSSKRKIMAECLVPEKVPSHLIEAIYVGNRNAADKITKSVPSLSSSNISVISEPGLFFENIKKADLTKNLSLVQGDLFFSNMQTLTISVNCVGVMGRGLASRAKYQFPDVYVHYQDMCKKKTLRMGRPVLYRREGSYHELLADDSSVTLTKENVWFLHFPTKDHWRNNSNIDDIEKGLQWLVDNYKNEGISSLAIPALGCGLGKLKWKDAGPVICRYLSRLDIPVMVYLPVGENIDEKFLSPEFLLQGQIFE